MTPDEKRERRHVRHQLQKAAAKSLSRDLRMRTTPSQQKAAGKIIADQLLNGRNPQDYLELGGKK